MRMHFRIAFTLHLPQLMSSSSFSYETLTLALCEFEPYLWSRSRRNISRTITMEFMDNSRRPLIPSFLYSPTRFIDFEQNLTVNQRNSFSSSRSTPLVSSSPSPSTQKRGFVIPAPSEQRKIAMFSPAYYGACTAGGIFSCGLTHMAVTPLDLVKCNMQVDLLHLSIYDFSYFYWF